MAPANAPTWPPAATRLFLSLEAGVSQGNTPNLPYLDTRLLACLGLHLKMEISWLDVIWGHTQTNHVSPWRSLSTFCLSENLFYQGTIASSRVLEVSRSLSWGRRLRPRRSWCWGWSALCASGRTRCPSRGPSTLSSEERRRGRDRWSSSSRPSLNLLETWPLSELMRLWVWWGWFSSTLT